MNGRTITTLVLWLTFSCLLAYDFFAVWKWGYPGTISLVIYTAAKDWPLLPFAFGVVCGHLFFPIQGANNVQDDKKPPDPMPPLGS